ncbi:MAG: hypothetical protein ABIJ09_20325 [Pseudomonadota bacterium]
MLALALLLSCGPARDPQAPFLTNLSYDGQAQRNAMVLLFSVDLEDSEGDLAAGVLRPFVNDRDTGEAPVPLDELLLASSLPQDAVQGRLLFNLEVEMSLDPATRPQSGATFKVGVEIEDASQHASNRPSVTLQIGYP